MSWFGSRDRGKDFDPLREEMVEKQLRARGIADSRVLAAMGRVPRHAFVPDTLQGRAYADGPLPIGEAQTISQPYVVAAMTEALALEPGMRVLEIGTGSGYQTAVLAEMGVVVFSVERLEALSRQAQKRLEKLGYQNITFRIGDGSMGCPEAAPFDGIIVTACPARLPSALDEQLAPGGRLVTPVGEMEQELRVYEKSADGSLVQRTLFPVRFVPLIHPSSKEL